ncbi:hypothetical protein NP233_g2840 [Leucocoprinus birnbaumii]|uniref:Uncharacterized protein n=1 Tax=Leucocoprinus birnbaumii TaxID=56174 RepID=A0AAD5YYF3_9AGAR|nr:hypothetical protein NP233_g2840 [Leucocoprinus birnbaumii]
MTSLSSPPLSHCSNDMASLLMEDDSLPSYEIEEDQALPVYSTHVSSSECLLQIEPPRMSNCPACDWMFETKHMRVNLGPRLWNLHSPSYGLNGRIEGSIRLSGDQDRVESVTMTLEGRIRVTSSQRSTMSADTVLTLVSRTETIYDSTKADFFPWDEDNEFSLTIPHETEFRGQTITLPPSHFSFHQLISTEVFYTVKFDVKRKSKGIKKHESREIKIEPEHLIIRKVRPMRFCQNIPFTLSLVFPEDPALASLLTKNIRIHLLRRLNVWKKGAAEVIQRDSVLTSATLRYGREYQEGITFLRGEIRAGDQGKEVSWSLDAVAEVQYVLRVMLRPPTTLIGAIPCFKHEEVIQVTTDSWGILDRELSSMGGTPTPAIGLAANIRRLE